MCPLKREQATRVSYDMLTHSVTLDSIVDVGEKVGHELPINVLFSVIKIQCELQLC